MIHWHSIGSWSSTNEQNAPNFDFFISLLYGFVGLIFAVASDFFLKLMSLKSTKKLHDSMLYSILRSKMVNKKVEPKVLINSLRFKILIGVSRVNSFRTYN